MPDQRRSWLLSEFNLARAERLWLALQVRHIPGCLMDLEPVIHVLHATHKTRSPQHFWQFVRKNLPSQSHRAVVRTS